MIAVTQKFRPNGSVMYFEQYVSPFIQWYTDTIAGSPIWSGIGAAAVCLLALAAIWLFFRIIFFTLRGFSRWISGLRQEGWQGYGIAVAPLSGPGGQKASAVLIEALEQELEKFSFGAPFSIFKAPAPKATKRFGLRDIARRWMTRSEADMVIWGHRSGKRREFVQLDILSREGTKSPEEAVHTRVHLPRDFAQAPELVRRISAYLVARALQPGLAQATAFKAEKIAPVAGILADALALENAFPPETVMLLETDYCAMGIHISDPVHLTRVVTLRRKRLAEIGDLSLEDQIAARIDLGRALLAQSEINFDPTRIREAMDHLKIAVDQLKYHPTIKVATATTTAVQKGQSMLQNRRRFSVTGGGI